MKRHLIVSSLLLTLWAPAPLMAQLTLDQVLEKVDQRGRNLTAMRAAIMQKKWTDILEEFDDGEQGLFYFLKADGKVYLRRDMQPPYESALVIRDGEVVFYQPRIKQVQKHSLGKKKDKAEFLLLGFGSDREELEKVYDLRLLEKEVVRGRDTYPLEMVPRSDEVSAFFSKIVLWIDAEMWVPIQQKLLEPNQDYLLIRFEEIKLNPSLRKSNFDLKIPKDVKVIKS